MVEKNVSKIILLFFVAFLLLGCASNQLPPSVEGTPAPTVGSTEAITPTTTNSPSVQAASAGPSAHDEVMKTMQECERTYKEPDLGNGAVKMQCLLKAAASYEKLGWKCESETTDDQSNELCYFSEAVVKKDARICEKLITGYGYNGTRDYCINFVAMAKHDPKECDTISAINGELTPESCKRDTMVFSAIDSKDESICDTYRSAFDTKGDEVWYGICKALTIAAKGSPEDCLKLGIQANEYGDIKNPHYKEVSGLAEGQDTCVLRIATNNKDAEVCNTFSKETTAGFGVSSENDRKMDIQQCKIKYGYWSTAMKSSVKTYELLGPN